MITTPKELVISTKIAENPTSQAASSNSSDMGQVSRDLATLAFAKMKQDGQLLIRQHEQLRRALAATGRSLGWASTVALEEDWAAGINKDVLRIARNGARALARELATQQTNKGNEMKRLKEYAKSVQKLADDPDTVYPREITYLHTARDSVRELVTKTEERIVNDADEALSVIRNIDKNLVRWEGLRDLMTIELKEKQKEVAAMKKNLSSFVQSLESLIQEVLFTLH